MRPHLLPLPLLLALACDRPAAPPPAPAAAPAPAAVPAPRHAVLGPGDTVPDASIYALDVTLTDQDDRRIKLDVFRGQPVLISMFYATCPHACPLLISNVQKLERSLPPAVRDKTRILLVSFDPARDTSAALRAVIAQRNLDPARWRLVSAPEEQVREIAAVLGIKYRETPGDGDGGQKREYNHSSVITLLDADGKIDLRTDGLVDASEQLAARLRTLTTK